ncbi:MAG: ATP-binding protein [Phycisphaerales bacterium]
MDTPNPPHHPHPTTPPAPIGTPIDIPAGDPHVRVELLSQPRYLSGARDLVAAIARRFGFDESACGQIALAVDEALCNIIRHGYDRRTDARIWIMIWPLGDTPGSAAADVTDPQQAANAANKPGPAPTSPTSASSEPLPRPTDPAGILIVIDDEARQVDPSIIKSRDLDDVRPGGLGVFIIQSVMDAVEYRHRTPTGMRLVMAKACDHEAAQRQRIEDEQLADDHSNHHKQDSHHSAHDHDGPHDTPSRRANHSSDPEESRGHAGGAPAGRERP